jgi:hypothetical protein
MSSVTIPLTDPLRPGSAPRALAIVTRRGIVSDRPTRVKAHGSIVVDARLRGGALAVAQRGPIWVGDESTRGLQRIDPASDLPSELRSRPGVVLAYRIVERPFELNLTIEPSPPRADVRTNATVVLRPGLALTESRLSFRTTPGRIFELTFPLPEDVQLEPLAPDEAVESSNVLTRADHGGVDAAGAARVLSIRLTTRAHESGVFALTLKTRQAIPEKGGPLRVRFLCPSGAEVLGGLVEVVRAPGINASVSTDGDGGLAPSDPPARDAWPWPVDRHADVDTSPLWFSSGGRPVFLDIDLSVVKPSYRSETSLVAEVDRSGISYQEKVTLEVLGKRLDDFELLAPPGVELGWSIEGLAVADRYPIESGPDGSSRHRIVLANKGASRVSFALRFRTKIDPPLGANTSTAGRFSLIRPIPAADGPIRLAARAKPGVRLKVDPAGWDDRSPPSTGGPSSISLFRPDSTGPLPAFQLAVEPLARLPDLLVPRTLLRTVRGSDELRTSAQFRIEVHGPSVVVSLPDGSRLIQTAVDGEPIPEVERTGNPAGYRLSLGPGAAGPQTLVVDYACPLSGQAAWQPPTLVGADTEACLWEVVMPGSQAVLGSPRGWSDENRWIWSEGLFRRTPTQGESDLLDWLAGADGSAQPGPDGVEARRAGQHAYLFRRSDGLAALPITMVPRSVLLVASTGLVALIGIGLVVAGPRVRPFALLAVAVVTMFLGAWAPNLMLQAIPSGLLGLVLTAVAAALQWSVNRRRAASASRYAGAPSTSTSTSTSGLAVAPADEDEPTAIRPRPPEAADRLVNLPPVPQESSTTGSEMGLRQ